MKVLSLFDGMGCARATLKNIGVEVDQYYASEIDKYAMTIAKKNHPDIVQLGDVQDFETWDLPDIDLLIAGFPCQAWSVAGHQKGLDDPRGALALTLLECFKKVRPKYFLFENVRMKKEHLAYMDRLFGVKHIMINSALLTAQNRVRCYWTNIPNISQPEDRGHLLEHILEAAPQNIAEMSDKFIARNAKILRYDFKGKAKCLSALEYAKNGRQGDYIAFNYSSSGRGNGVVEDRAEIGPAKAGTLTATGYTKRSFSGVYTAEGVRKLTPIECERLQGLPDNYTEGVSNTQRYKMLGNGFTVPVIEHILKHLNL